MKTPHRIIPFICLFLLSHCTPEKNDPQAYPVVVEDDLGREISLPDHPRRIVSLAPSLTETLFALGLDSGIVGVTDYCDTPEGALLKPRVGGLTNPDYEAIVRLRPDLVVMTFAGNSRKDFDKLVSLGLNVFVSNPATLEDIFRSILTLGRLCGRESESDSIVREMHEREAHAVRRSHSRPVQRILLLFSLRPLIAAGKGTFIDELLAKANLENVAREAPTAYPLLSREEILALQPDWIVCTDDVVHSIEEIVSAYPEWHNLDAVREKHIVLANADLISRPGPRIVLGLEFLVDATHR